MIAAESGGLPAINKEPVYDALIISTSMSNRIWVENNREEYPFSTKNSRSRFGIGTYQSLFTKDQYQASTQLAYQDFAYGHKKRFGENDNHQKVGLITIYRAMNYAQTKLRRNYDLQQAFQILAYAHKPSDSPGLFNEFDIAFDEVKAPNMNSVIGSIYWKPQ